MDKSFILNVLAKEALLLYAITSINITFFLKAYFLLDDKIANYAQKASKKAFKNFCLLGLENPNFLSQCHDLLLDRYLERYRKMLAW